MNLKFLSSSIAVLRVVVLSLREVKHDLMGIEYIENKKLESVPKWGQTMKNLRDSCHGHYLYHDVKISLYKRKSRAENAMNKKNST